MTIHKHLVITRFSIRASTEDEVPSKAWIDYRLELLEAYCLPTIAAQTVQELAWLLLCDEQTDTESLTALARALDTVPQAEIVLTTPERPYLDSLLAPLDPDDEVLITTRLDSDDGLGRLYIERVAAYIEPFQRSGLPAHLLCFSQGYKLDPASGRVYDSYQPNSPTVTLFERLDADRRPSTVYAGNHGYLNHRFPVHHDTAPGPWLQVVHGANVNNPVRIGDYPLPPTQLDEHFSIRPELVSDRPRVRAAQPDDPAALAQFRNDLERPAAGHEEPDY